MDTAGSVPPDYARQLHYSRKWLNTFFERVAGQFHLPPVDIAKYSKTAAEIVVQCVMDMSKNECHPQLLFHAMLQNSHLAMHLPTREKTTFLRLWAIWVEVINEGGRRPKQAEVEPPTMGSDWASDELDFYFKNTETNKDMERYLRRQTQPSVLFKDFESFCRRHFGSVQAALSDTRCHLKA